MGPESTRGTRNNVRICGTVLSISIAGAQETLGYSYRAPLIPNSEDGVLGRQEPAGCRIRGHGSAWRS